MIVYKAVKVMPDGSYGSLNKGRAKEHSREAERLMRSYKLLQWTSAPRVALPSGHTKVAPLLCFEKFKQAKDMAAVFSNENTVVLKCVARGTSRKVRVAKWFYDMLLVCNGLLQGNEPPLGTIGAESVFPLEVVSE